MMNVSSSTVPGDVHAGDLVFGGNSEQPELVQDQKQRAHGCRHPACDDKNLNDLGGQELASATHEEAVGPIGEIIVHLLHIVLLGEEADENEAPSPAPTVELGSSSGSS